MNKTNKGLNVILRLLIIVTWIASNISIVMLSSGIKNIETEGLSAENTGERLLKIISDFAGNTIYYYVTLGLLGGCLFFAILTRYKTRIVSYIFKILALGIALLSMLAGLDYVNAISACKGLNNLVVTGTDAASVASSLSAAGLTENVDQIAKTLTDSNESGAAVAGYFFPVIILFILVITSIHCLAKHSDPNAAQ